MTEANPGTQLVDAPLATSLENLREVARAGFVRLLRCPQGSCRDGAEETVTESTQVVICPKTQGCSRLAEGQSQLVAIFPPDPQEADTLFCANCPLNTGETLALQLGFSNAATTTRSQYEKLAVLGVPLLMWAKEGLERRLVEARLAELQGSSRAELVESLKAQEEEREWLALEVHDRIAQTLASVFQQLQTVESLTRSLPEIRRVAVRGSILCREAIREARNIMNDLRPPVLEELGLAPLVEEELRHLEEDTHCQIDVHVDGPARPPRDVEVTLYRIFHEAVINIRRHSRAKRVAVSLECGKSQVQLLVEDDGVGFDVPRALASKRVGGLISMQRRAEMAGGICRLKSQPGRGTSVDAWIPLTASKAQ